MSSGRNLAEIIAKCTPDEKDTRQKFLTCWSVLAVVRTVSNLHISFLTNDSSKHHVPC